MYDIDLTWKKLQQYLPYENRLDESNKPIESIKKIKSFSVHIDKYESKRKTNVTIVIFHGVGGNGRLLSFLAVPLFNAGYDVICPDLPGYGFSKYEIYPKYVDWIEIGSEIIQDEIKKNKKVIVMGLSAGGMLAYNISCMNKEVSGLIVTNILDNRIEEVKCYSAKNKFQAKYGIKILNIMPEFIKNIKVPISMVTNMNGLVNSKEILKLLKNDKRGAGSFVQIGFLLSMMNSKPVLEPEQFENIPVLLCHPGNDKWTPMKISELFFDRIKAQKTKISLENCGHFPIELPGKMNMEREIINFINLTTAST